MKTTTLFTLAALFIYTAAQSQVLTQTLRGRIVDDVSEAPLIGATVRLVDSTQMIGGITDVKGEFAIPEVPIGRARFLITYVGYENAIKEVLLHSGKSAFLNVRMKESYETLQEIVVKAPYEKDLPINEMIAVSGRSFSVEESQRYAGGLDDPGRMVSNFAGVTMTSLGHNAIVIRGNAPKGVQWRMEGIEIPSPSHFAGADVTGGGLVTLLSNQVLDNSDFLTGAFPSEYGNAMAGVFDMNMRKGNSDEYEHTFQAGLLGLDIASEGPLVKGGDASYLFNYRYSTLGLIEPALPEETNTIRYQDLSFKFHLPAKNAGQFSVWGVGGKDYGRKNEELAMSREEWETGDDREDYEYGFLVGAAGVSHKINFGTHTMLQSGIAASANDSYWDVERLDDSMNLNPESKVDNLTGQLSFSTILNHKFSSKHTNKTGALFHQQFYDILIQESPGNIPPLQSIVDQNGSSQRVQWFSQSKFRLNPHFSVNLGVHSQYFALNEQLTIEPRASLQYMPNYRQSFSIGYGNHSQLEDLKIYFVQDAEGRVLNDDLNLTRAHHLVFSYDWLIADDVRLKVEPYFQYLYDVPVVADSSFSMLNFTQDWFQTADLTNDGKGRNYGIDFTLERFLKDNFYYLATGSVFRSEYRGGDNVWRRTHFDRGYAVNLLAGKEWQLGANRNKWLGVNGGLNLMGGLRYSPVDHEASSAEQEVIFDENNAYANRSPNINYMDITVSYRKNRERFSSVWSLQVKNLLGYEDFEGYNYNFSEDIVEEDKSTIVIPNLSYKIEF